MAMLSVLQIIQEMCRRNALPVPLTAVSNTDPGVQQYIGLFNELMQKTVKDYRFEVLTSRPTWTSVATNIQGNIGTLTGLGSTANIESIQNGTVWDFTLRRPIFGPLSDQNIQIITALIPNGPIFQYRIEDDNLQIWPAPPAGNTHGCVVRSKAWCGLAGSTTNTSYYIQNDTDVPLLDDTVIITGLSAWFRKKKGLPYAEDMDTFNSMCGNMAIKDGTNEVLYLDKASTKLLPGIFVPSGNWALSGGS
jgi:hypothetical protein